MPFISKDWRSPGDYWVKNGSGWERFKVLQYMGGSQESGPGQEAEQNHQNQQQPHCRINLRQTREISGFNTLSEALQLLDFQSALRDQRKFQYICVIIRLLISNPYLGGISQRILVKLLYQICYQARVGWRYDLLRIIIPEMRKSLDSCWGGNLGSAQLWNENKVQIDKIEELLATYADEAPRIPLQDFPEEIIRLIVLKLNNDTDIKNLAESDNSLQGLVSENRIWRQLCVYHFSRENIINAAIKLQQEQQKKKARSLKKTNNLNLQGGRAGLRKTGIVLDCDVNMESNNNNKESDDSSSSGDDSSNDNEEGEKIDWETVYKYLKRNFSLKEEYAEVLNYCKPCNVLFWPSFGHPCIVGTSVFLEKGKENKDLFVDVKPCDFISFFST